MVDVPTEYIEIQKRNLKNIKLFNLKKLGITHSVYFNTIHLMSSPLRKIANRKSAS